MKGKNNLRATEGERTNETISVHNKSGKQKKIGLNDLERRKAESRRFFYLFR